MIQTEEQRELLLKMVNEWSFKSFIMTYSEEKLLDKFFHKLKLGDEYSIEESNEMNVLRDKWIRYHKGEYDSKMPEQWAKFKQTKY